MQPASYRSQEVAGRANVAYRSLMRWVQQGLLEPVRTDTTRERAPFTWSEKNLREATVLGQLRAHCLPLRTIRDVMTYLRGLGHNPFSTGRFVCVGRPQSGGTVIKICDDGEVIDLIQRGQLVLPTLLDEER